MGGNPEAETITKMGLPVNLAEGTVLGFSPAARIKSTDAVTVEFEGQSISRDRFTSAVNGSIDRIMGSVDATITGFDKATSTLTSVNRRELLCTPVKRVF